MIISKKHMFNSFILLLLLPCFLRSADTINTDVTIRLKSVEDFIDRARLSIDDIETWYKTKSKATIPTTVKDATKKIIDIYKNINSYAQQERDSLRQLKQFQQDLMNQQQNLQKLKAAEKSAPASQKAPASAAVSNAQKDIRTLERTMITTLNKIKSLQQKRKDLDKASKMPLEVIQKDKNVVSTEAFNKLPDLDSIETSNALEALELHSSGNKDDIKKKYKELSLKWSPNKCSAERKNECTEQYQKIKSAYDILKK